MIVSKRYLLYLVSIMGCQDKRAILRNQKIEFMSDQLMYYQDVFAKLFNFFQKII